MTEQYRTICPDIQGFLSDVRSFHRTCPSVRRYFVFTVYILKLILQNIFCAVDGGMWLSQITITSQENSSYLN
jgi:hypothetical protein